MMFACGFLVLSLWMIFYVSQQNIKEGGKYGMDGKERETSEPGVTWKKKGSEGKELGGERGQLTWKRKMD